jgi:hypothetical protein
MVAAAKNTAGSPLDNLNKTPAEQLAAAVADWSGALEAVLGQRPHAMTTLQIVTKTGELYRGGVFQPSESTKYAARVRAISRDRLASWSAVINQFESDVDGPNILWFLVRQPAMFDGSVLREAIADRQLLRLRGLPAEAVERWSKVTEVSKGAAVFVLIRVDPLFEDAAFQPAVFDVALPLAEKRIREDTARK